MPKSWHLFHRHRDSKQGSVEEQHTNSRVEVNPAASSTGLPPKNETKYPIAESNRPEITSSTVEHQASQQTKTNVEQPSQLPTTPIAQEGLAKDDPNPKPESSQTVVIREVVTQQQSESNFKETNGLSIQQSIWNDAYDHLDQDKETSGIVKAYVNILVTVLAGRNASDLSASGADDVSVKLKDPAERQKFMKSIVKQGLAKASTASKIVKNAGNVADAILSVKEVVDLAIGNIPQAALPWAGVCIGIQMLLNPIKNLQSNRGGISYIISKMDWYCSLSDEILKENNIRSTSESLDITRLKLRGGIVSLYKALLLYQMKSVCAYYRNQFLDFLRNVINMDSWNDSLKSIKDEEASLRILSEQYNQQQNTGLLDKLVSDSGNNLEALNRIQDTLQENTRTLREFRDADMNKSCLEELYVVNPEGYMKQLEEKKDKLVQKAYDWIFQNEAYSTFTNAGDDGSAREPCRMLWIKGPAGTGKTMLMMGIIRELSGPQLAVSPDVYYFFCQGTDENLNNATSILKCLVWSLLNEQPHLIQYLRSRQDNSGKRLFQDSSGFYTLASAFEEMIKDPNMPPVYFAIDALDECDEAEPGLNQLLNVISNSLKVSDKVRWLLSSRPHVGDRFKRSNPSLVKNMVELDAQVLGPPVKAYIDYKLNDLKEQKEYDDATVDELSKILHQGAGNTFLWASLICKELELVNSWDAVDTVKTFPPGLTELYDHLMGNIEKLRNKDPEYCKNILVAVSLAYRPFSLLELSLLAGLPPRVPTREVVKLCGSFITVDNDTVYLIHQSAQDYLKANHLSRLQNGGEIEGHAELCRRSIHAMSKLKTNIYDLEDWGIESKGVTSPNPDPLAALRYPCAFWLQHLCAANIQETNYTSNVSAEDILDFLKTHFLHWLESISLMGGLSDSVAPIRRLRRIAQVASHSNTEFMDYLIDAEKLTSYGGSIIEQWPLQAYGTVLAFCPLESKIKQQCWEQRLPYLRNIRGLKNDWNAQLQSFEIDDEALSFAFSPRDGLLLAMGNADGVVEVWNTATGTRLKVLKGHSWNATSLAFSEDGSTLASAGLDGTVWVWDVAKGTGSVEVEIPKFAEAGIYMSPLDGTLEKVCWVYDHEVKLWDKAIEAQPRTIYSGEGSYPIVKLSSDGSRMAVGTVDGTVRVWNLKYKVSKTPSIVYSHKDTVRGMEFSSDGSFIVSFSREGIVQIWGTDTKATKPLVTLERDVESAALSPNALILALALSDMTVELWDLSTSKDIFRQKLEANRNAVNVVRFSPDGLMLLTSCSDPSVRLWDISAMATPSPTVEGHSSWIKDLCFSPDKSFLASASNDGTVRLWGLSSTTKSAIPNRTLNTGVVSKLVFSSDGTTLQTDNGDFKLEAAENEIASAQQADSNPSTPVPSRLSLSGDWIVYNKTRLLRIPPDHLPLYAISCERGIDGDVLAFGDPTGTVSILEFNVISE